MANTYTQLYVHYIFAVQNRLCLLKKQWREDLYMYITGIVEQQKHKLYIINGIDDHIHCLISMAPKQSPSDLMYHVKRSSSLWINQNKLTPGHFSWQEGYGAFSLGKAQLSEKIAYIENQQQHHRKIPFIVEYKDFLKENEISFDEKFIFKAIE